VKRLAAIVLLAAGLLALALWLTREPTEEPSDSSARRAEDVQSPPRPDAALLGRGSAGGDVATAVGDTFALLGLVVDENDRPVADVSVRMEHDERKPSGNARSRRVEEVLRGRDGFVAVGPTLRTGEDGRFRIDGLVAGESYRCALRPPAPFVESLRWVRSSRTEPLEVCFVLRRGDPFRARVVDASGHGIAAFVSARGSRDETPMPWLPRRETDAEGRFALDALPAGTWYFDVAVAGRGIRWGIPVSAPASGEVLLPFRLADGGAIAGRVTDGEEHPIAGAHVLAELERHDLGRGVLNEAVAETDGDGLYRMEGLDPGRLQGITVEAEGFATQTGLYSRFPVTAGGVLEANVILASASVLRGRVLDEAGRPLPGALVQLEVGLPGRGTFPTRDRRSTVADAEGRYAFEHLAPAGVGTLRAYTSEATTPIWDTEHSVHTVNLEAGGPVVELDLVLTVLPPLCGIVEDAAGRPVARIPIRAESVYGQMRQRQGLPLPRATSDAEGRFALAGLLPGESWFVEVDTPGLLSEALPPSKIPFPPEVPPEVRLVVHPPAALRGRLVDSEGRGMADQPLHLVADGSGAGSPGSGSRSLWTAGDGAFAFEGLRAGGWKVPGRRDDAARGAGEQRFELAWGQVLEGVTVVREPMPVISGVVVDPRGEPVARAVVECRRTGSRDRSSGDTGTTGADGRFTLRVAPGTYDVWAHEGETAASVEAGTTNLVLQTTARPSREIAGTVVDAEGRPVPRAEVTIWVRQEAGRRGFGVACTMGAFRTFVESAEAKADIVVEDARDAAGRLLDLQPGVWKDVDLEGGELHLRLEAGLVLEGRAVDASGRGVAGVQIETHFADHDEPGLGGYAGHVDLPQARTDDEGRFRLTGLVAAPMQLVVHPPPGWIVPPARRVVPGEGPVELRLERGHALAGRVLDAEGGPVRGARLRVDWIRAEDGEADSADATTDERGVFRLEGVGAGPLTVTVEGPWTAPWPYRPARLEDVASDTLDLEIRLEAGRDLAGVVVDPDGHPVPNARVSILGGDPQRYLLPVAADAEGRFVVAQLEAGSYVLTASGGEEWAPSPRTTVVVPATDVRLVLGRTWLLHGTVVGRPDEAKEISFLYHEDGEPRLEGVGYSGAGPFSFRVQTDRPGTLLLRIESTGEYALIEDVKPGTGPHRLVPQPGRTLAGRIEGGALREEGEQVTGIDARGIRLWTRAAPDGTFSFTGVPPGIYRLEAWVTRDGSTERYVAESAEAGATDVVLRPAP